MIQDLVNIPGKEVTITVDCSPGGADPVHRHNASAFVYVLEGSIVMQMKGGEKVTLHPGDTFYEDPVRPPIVTTRKLHISESHILSSPMPARGGSVEIAVALGKPVLRYP